MAARRIALLESVVNPTNVGAIIRSAAGPEHRRGSADLQPAAIPLYRRAARVSMGTVFSDSLDLSGEKECGSWPEPGMDYLKSLGFSTASMALHSQSVDIDDPRLKQEEKLAVILGSEGYGLREETILASDYTIKIHMSHGVYSLNVAAASAVAFWELGKLKEMTVYGPLRSGRSAPELSDRQIHGCVRRRLETS